jgi:protein-disulfide isomerase
VFKHNPLSFHNNALPAAHAAECAREQGKFWEMHDKLFANQRALAAPQLTEYAQAVGLDMARYNDCFAAERYESRIKRDQATAVSLGAGGTPAFFVNGRFLSGAQPFPAFKAVIDEELGKAKQSGIAKADYYPQAIIAKGAKQP